MAQTASDDVRAELRASIAQDQTLLGEVFPLVEQGLSAQDIARKLGRNTPGFVSNYRTQVQAIMEGAIPGGSTIARQTGAALRRVASTPGLSAGAGNHLLAVIDELDRAAADQAPRPKPSSDPGTSRVRSKSQATNLRGQVDATVRTRANELIKKIRDETHVDADDYYRVCSAAFAFDEVTRLVVVQATSRTTRALHAVERLDLSIEQALLDWARDLPVTADLVESARGRLAYWRST